MENSDNRITTILDEAERNLREVIAEAAQAGDYHSVDVARVAALEIRNLRARVKSPPIAQEPQRSNTSPHVTSKRKGQKSAYPKFEVRNGTLIRVGWSKKNRREYTHKAPKTVFEQTIKAMASIGQTRNGAVMAEQIIEQLESTSSEHIPSYQVYTVLGLLRDRDCIQKIGNEGYRWSEGLEDSARKIWAQYEEATT